MLDSIVFLAPFLHFVEINITGQLTLTEVILAALFPILVIRGWKRLSAPLPKMFISLLALWFIGQVITDVVRLSIFKDYARGWALIVFTLINFCSIYLLLARNSKRIVLFAAGFAIGRIVSYLVAPSADAMYEPWKFGFGPGIGWLMVLLAAWVSGRPGLARFQPAAILFLLAVLNVIGNSRAAGGIAMLSAFYLGMQSINTQRPGSQRIRFRRMIALFAILSGTAWGSLQIYEHAAQAGWLGDRALKKYQMQAAGEYGAFIGGRSEIFASSTAVMDSPLIGHGSWAKDCRYSSLYVELKRRAGYNPGEESETCLIPTHSHLMGSWVQAGVLGALFWLWVLKLPLRVLSRLDIQRERLSPLIVYLSLFLVWHIFFSPFAGERRFVIPFIIVTVMSCLPSGPSSRSVPSRRRLSFTQQHA